VGWALLFLGCGFVLTTVFALGLALATGTPLAGEPTSGLLVIQTVAGLGAFGLMTWAIGFRGLGFTTRDLRWAPLERAGRGFGLGLVLGAVPALVALGLSTVVGQARFVPDEGGLGDYGVRMGLTALLLAPAALMEELMFRGVPQVVLARAFGRLPAILALSVTFALAHVLNPNSTALGLLNIALAGILLGLAFYLPGGLWTAWGVHLGWNGALAAVDAPVSGHPFTIPMIDYLPGEPAWLTGGSFGPEGGLLASVAIALAASVAWRRREERAA
jgi:hypothetical protein